MGCGHGQATYGYRHLQGGKPGEFEIDPKTSEIVRRIFTEYASEISVRDIAKGLTRDGVYAWGHQALLGGGDGGILSNRLYIGESIWGKQYSVKDLDTHKTSHRWRPESEWIKVPVPHLRIIDQQLWDSVQRLRQSRQPLSVSGEVVVRRPIVRNKTHLLSGLLRCGQCNGPMIMASVSKGDRYERCAAAHMKSTCTHGRRYMIDKLKHLVVENLCATPDPEFEARQKRAYNLQFAKMARDDSGGERADIEKQIAKLKIQQQRISDLITDGDIDVDVAALKAKLKAKEIEPAGLAERLRRLAGENVITLPNAYDAYRKNVETLHRRLIDEIDDPSEAVRIAFRNLMDSIVVQPTLKGEPYVVDAYGSLAASAIDLFPKTRSVQEIVAAEGVPDAAMAASKVTPY